jgi:hypothetical protein
MALASSYTTIVALDSRTVEQFQGVWPTWRLKAGVLDHPMLCICDWRAGDKHSWRRRLRWMGHPDRRLVCWDWPDRDDTAFAGMTQRERMLTSFVKLPPLLVETQKWVKIDTDVVATDSTPWFDESWLGLHGPRLVGSPWGYSKPADTCQRLDDWAAGIPELGKIPSLSLPPPQPGQKRIGHPRICSWIAVIDTVWSRRAADFVPGRLPVPSQDGYHWYVAYRMGERIDRVRFADRGWATVSKDGPRAKLVAEVLGKAENCCG